MKAITIIQPWATLIATGEKKFETRSWSTKHRGEIAIHAGKKINKEACSKPEIKEALDRHGYTVDNLPTGAVVATALLNECYEVIRENSEAQMVMFDKTNGTKFWEVNKNGNEFAFGDFSLGRYAWEMAEVELMDKPLPAKGQQGLWNLANQF